MGTGIVIALLLLLAVVAAAVSAAAARVPTHVWPDWWAFGLAGACLGVFTLTALLALGGRWPWLRVILVCVMFPSLLVAAWLGLAQNVGWIADGRQQGSAPAGRTTADFPRQRAITRKNSTLLTKRPSPGPTDRGAQHGKTRSC